MSWKVGMAIIASIILPGCTPSISIEEKDVPYKVLDSFKAKYPQFNGATWELGKDGNSLIYEVDFMVNRKRIEAEFTKHGGYIGEYVFQSSPFKESNR